MNIAGNMNIAGSIGYLIMLLAGLVGLGIQIWALVDCLTARPDAFERADKRSKTFWLAITVVSTLAGVLYVFSEKISFSLLLMLAGCVGAGTYLADVRPAVRNLRRGGKPPQGPYGGW